MVCPKCNNNISDNSLFCPFCGEKVGEYQKQQESGKQVVDHIDYIPYVQQNPFAHENPYREKNPYYNQQQNLYQQPTQMYYGTPMYDGMREYSEYNKKATDLRTFGIIAAVLMFGIGIIFSIIIWVNKASLKEPMYPPQNMYEDNLFRDAQSKLRTANILAILPVVGFIIGFIIGFVSVL